MKKKLTIILLLVLTLFCGVVFMACGDEKEPPELPRTVQPIPFGSFDIYTVVEGNGLKSVLTWQQSSDSKFSAFEIELNDGTKFEQEDSQLLLHDFSAGEVHTVKVKVKTSDGLESTATTIKFKKNKYTAPSNVHFKNSSTITWDEVGEGIGYYVQYQGVDFDKDYNWYPTGEIFNYYTIFNELDVPTLTNFLQNNDMKNFYDIRVFAVHQNYQYATQNSEGVFEFNSESDCSESAVKILAAPVSNPTGLEWDVSDVSNGVYVSWKDCNTNFKHEVISPAGVAAQVNAGEKSGRVYMDATKSGEYQIIVRPVVPQFAYPMSSGFYYRIDLPQPIEEKLTFNFKQIKLQTPQNLRIEGDYVVWDAVEKAQYYYVGLTGSFGYRCEDTNFSVQKFFETVNSSARRDGSVEQTYNIVVYAERDGIELESFENNIPTILTYINSDYAEFTKANTISFKSVDEPQDININGTMITWAEVSEAETYTVYFSEKSTGTSSTTKDCYVDMKNVPLLNYEEGKVQYVVVGVYVGECNIIIEDGIVTIYVSSGVKINLQENS